MKRETVEITLYILLIVTYVIGITINSFEKYKWRPPLSKKEFNKEKKS